MIREIKVKTALSPSRLPGLDYAMNPYHGCSHACIYCYAPSVIHWDKGKWGKLIEVKANLPRILSRELRRKKKGIVGLGTVTDPYQPVEKRYEITRRCLEFLLMHDLPVCIQTKSSMVLRDIDLLKKFSNIEVGITFTVLEEKTRMKMEPGASSIEERLRSLKELKDNGISTWVFLGPVMPYITDVEAIIEVIALLKPEYVLVDRLRLKGGVLSHINEFIQGYDPQLLPVYKRIFQSGEDYYAEIFKKALRKCKDRCLKCGVNMLDK
jgi:DNA repair photolyase